MRSNDFSQVEADAIELQRASRGLVDDVTDLVSPAAAFSATEEVAKPRTLPRASRRVNWAPGAARLASLNDRSCQSESRALPSRPLGYQPGLHWYK